jgi:class 3 adenylate cyclase
MSEERVQRRLAAIMSADVVGYSRLMGSDEAGTLSRLNALRRELIDPTIAVHSGRIVKLMGDGALVEFASAVDAVTCAIEIQRKLGSMMPMALKRPRSNFGSASTLAISSSTVMTSLATAST